MVTHKRGTVACLFTAAVLFAFVSNLAFAQVVDGCAKFLGSGGLFDKRDGFNKGGVPVDRFAVGWGDDPGMEELDDAPDAAERFEAGDLGGSERRLGGVERLNKDE